MSRVHFYSRVLCGVVLLTGAPGLRAETVVAIAVNGRVEQTTRVYGRSSYAALVPPSSLHDGDNTIAVFRVDATDSLVRVSE